MKCLLLTLSLLLTSCVSDVANRYYLAEKLPPRPVSEVSVLYSKPDRPFEVIADFQSRGESTSSLQKKAAEIGAEAVIVSSLGGRYSFKEKWAGSDRFSGTGSRIVGTAIRFK